MENRKNVTISLPVGWITFLTLVILKATETIEMSWFWVITSCIWAPLAVLAVIFIFIIFIAALAAIFGG